MLYTTEQINAKLKQVEEFEAKYGSNNTTRAWRKWCEDPEYREREAKWRYSLAEYVDNNRNTRFL